MSSGTVEAKSASYKKYNHICRLCLSEESLDDVFKVEQLQSWISEFLSITISKTDEITKAICAICRIRLTEFQEFRVRCLDVQAVLQATIQYDSIVAEKSIELSFDLADANQLPSAGSQEQNGYHPISCEVCHMAFEDEIQLSSHMEVHETEQLLGACCGSSFATRKLLHQPLNHADNDLGELLKVKAELDDSITIEETIIVKEEVIETYSGVNAYLTNKTSVEANVTTQKVHLENAGSEQKFADTQTPNHVEAFNTEKIKPQCTICNKTYATRHKFLTHMRNSHGPKRHKCDLCGVKYILRVNLTKHFNSKKHLKKLRTTHGSENETLPTLNKVVERGMPCDNRFSNTWKLNNNRPKTYICPTCEKPCRNSTALKNHIPIHDRIAKTVIADQSVAKPFECDICHNAYRNKQSLWKHKTAVHGERTHECEICGFKFKTRDTLTKHMQKHTLRRHTKEDFQLMRMIKEKEASSVRIENHVDENTSDGTTNNPTPEQNVQSSSEASAQQPFLCEVCSRSFQSSVLLTRHKRNVHMPKKNKCPVCGKLFAYRKQRSMHMKLHSPESSSTSEFECRECHKIFPSWKSLYIHVKDGHVKKTKHNIQSNEKFDCPECDKSFPQSNSLSIHMRTVHSGGKHQCNICNKEFSVHLQLWRHIKTQHESKSPRSSDLDSDGDFKLADQRSNNSEDKSSDRATESGGDQETHRMQPP